MIVLFVKSHLCEQTEVRTVRARNKERGAIVKSLEERAAQRDTEVARLVEQMSSLKMQLASKENEVSSLQAQLLETRGHVAQLSKELEASKATFEFVHQQLEESRSRHAGSYMASTVPPSTSMRGALDSMSRSDLASMQVRAACLCFANCGRLTLCSLLPSTGLFTAPKPLCQPPLRPHLVFTIKMRPIHKLHLDRSPFCCASLAAQHSSSCSSGIVQGPRRRDKALFWPACLSLFFTHFLE